MKWLHKKSEIALLLPNPSKDGNRSGLNRDPPRSTPISARFGTGIFGFGSRIRIYCLTCVRFGTDIIQFVQNFKNDIFQIIMGTIQKK